MLKVLENYNPLVLGDGDVLSKNHLDYVKIILLQEELQVEKLNLYNDLSKDEKNLIYEYIARQFNLSEYINDVDVAEILGTSPGIVRISCKEGKLKCFETLAGSGKWRIETKQFMGHRNWDNYLVKRMKLKLQSINIAEKVIEYLEDK